MGYNRQRIVSCKIGVDSPTCAFQKRNQHHSTRSMTRMQRTTQLKNQLVAVEIDTPLTLNVRGRISGGYSLTSSSSVPILPHAQQKDVPRQGTPGEPKRGVEDDDARDDCNGRVGSVQVEEVADRRERGGHDLQFRASARFPECSGKGRTSAPERRIGLRPQMSTRYQVGIVERM